METKYTLIVDQAKDRIVDAFVATKRFPAKDKIPAFLRGLESGELLWTVETSPLARQFKETDRQMARTYAGVLPDGSFFKVTVTPVIGGGGQINLNAVKIDAMQYTSKNGICQPIWMNTEFSTQGQMLFGKVCPTTPGKFTAEDFLQIKRRMGDSSPLPETEEVSASKSLLRIAQAILAA
jgi:hypothetical protein